MSSPTKECVKCNENISNENTCDFCEKNYCDKCCPDNRFYVSCKICGHNWCIYNDDYCEINKKRRYISNGCYNCGN